MRATADGAGMCGLAREVRLLADRFDIDLCGYDRDLGALSSREHEVLRLLAAGCSNRQIATELFISEPTVRTHVSSILRKIGCATRGEAAATAHAAGLC